MGFDLSRSENEHELLPEILDQAIVGVVREEIFGTDRVHEDFKKVSSNEHEDYEILRDIDWEKTGKRSQKWMLMSGEFIRQVDRGRREKAMLRQEDSGPQTDQGAMWHTHFNEAADVVAFHLPGVSAASSVKSGLRRTFVDDTEYVNEDGEEDRFDFPIDIVREVFRRVYIAVHEHSDVTVDEVIAAHEDAINSLR